MFAVPFAINVVPFADNLVPLGGRLRSQSGYVCSPVPGCLRSVTASDLRGVREADFLHLKY